MRTKLRPPRVRDGLIDRPRLVERLQNGRERALTLVCAPAGYGKTTVIAQWQSVARETMPFVWVALDERDSDPVRLWTHLVTAVAERIEAQQVPASPPTPAAIEDVVLPRLVEALDACAGLVVVLDDWHLVRNTVCDRTVGRLIERAPEQVQIVVSSRSEPGLPIARLRAHGDLQELRAADLRVSSAEGDELFRSAGIKLPKRDVERIVERTEGWPAALGLALIALSDEDDPKGFVREFAGATSHAFDYLADDVLAQTEPATRDFLVRSSMLARLSAPLCDAALGRSDSADMLAQLERENLFLVPVEESAGEYRYHHLFETLLRRELATLDPADIRELHARASRWFEEQGEVEHAVDHAIESRDLERISPLVTIAAVPLLSIGRMATVNTWFGKLSWPEARADRPIAGVRALSAGLSGDGRDAIEQWLHTAETGPDFGPVANGISSMRSLVSMVSSIYLSRGVEDAIASATFVLDAEPSGSEWRYAGLVPLGQALYLAGRHDEAQAPLEEARKLPHASHRATTLIAISYLALIELAAGRQERAQALADEGLALAGALGHATSSGASLPHLASGCVKMHGPDLPGAVEHLERSAHLAGEEAPSYWRAHALVYLAAARHRLGDDDGAHDALAQARAALDVLPDSGALGVLCDETHVSLRQRSRRDGYLGQELSAAESRIVQHLVDGLSVSDVAHELWLSPNTVKTHRRNIYRKLGASNRQELVVRAGEIGVEPRATADVHPG